MRHLENIMMTYFKADIAIGQFAFWPLREIGYGWPAGLLAHELNGQALLLGYRIH